MTPQEETAVSDILGYNARKIIETKTQLFVSEVIAFDIKMGAPFGAPATTTLVSQ